jgi:rhodanese-related sulfurtransferase
MRLALAIAFFLSLALVVQAIISPDTRSRTGMCHVSAEEFVELDFTDAVLIDVRTPAEYRSGHLDGAILIDVRARDFQDRIGQLDKQVAYYVYCKTGIRSAHAVKYMQQAGFARVCNVEGGLGALRKLGTELVQ